MKRLLILIFLLSSLNFLKSEIEIRPNLVGGEDASIFDYPFMASVQINWFGEGFIPFCGGAIVSRMSILTAAHCLYANLDDLATPRDVRVTVGSSFRDGRFGMTYSSLRLIRHPNYSLTFEKIENDLAIIRLIVPLVFTRTIQPIPLGKSRVRANDRMTVLGFGWIRENEFATRLQKTQMRAITNTRCLWIHRNTVPDRVTPEMVCLTGDQEQGVCTGDSGSPLEKDGYLVGITCWTMRPCGSTPSVYTRLSVHYNWINENI